MFFDELLRGDTVPIGVFLAKHAKGTYIVYRRSQVNVTSYSYERVAHIVKRNRDT